MWKTAIQPLISLMKLSLPIMFLVWPFFSGKTSLLQNVCPEDKVFLQVRSGIYSCRNIQYVERCSAIRLFHEVQPPSHFLHDICCLKERRHLFKIMMPILFRSFIHIIWKGILHTYNHDVFFFLRHLFHRHWSHGQIPSCLRGRRLGWEGGRLLALRRGDRKTGRVAIGVVGGAQG